MKPTIKYLQHQGTHSTNQFDNIFTYLKHQYYIHYELLTSSSEQQTDHLHWSLPAADPVPDTWRTPGPDGRSLWRRPTRWITSADPACHVGVCRPSETNAEWVASCPHHQHYHAMPQSQSFSHMHPLTKFKAVCHLRTTLQVSEMISKWCS